MTNEIKIRDYLKIENRGVGKVIALYPVDECNETGTIVIEIADQKYYRDINGNNEIIDKLNDTSKVTEKEYMQYLKEMIKQLNAQSKNKRKQAAEYNKETNGEATKRKGKVSVQNGNITSLVENSLSSHHRNLLTDAKKTKELKDNLKKELEKLKRIS